MSHNIENVSSTKRKIAISIDAKEVNNSINSTIREYGKNLNINGFRKGKVPASVIEKRFNEEVYNYATENLINTTINKILDEAKIRPVSRVQFENQDEAKKLARDTNFEFTCTFEVLPEIELPKDFSEYSVNVESAEATQEEIETACKMASVHDFIMTLSDGYKTSVGSLGDNLSAGEKQRIGLARAFLSGSKLILLDEPTSNVDSINEGIILKALKEQKNNRSIILVSHRESTMSIADRIYSIKDGKIKECD